MTTIQDSGPETVILKMLIYNNQPC